MENKNEKVINTLSELGEFVKDGKLGYKKAADETKDASIKQFCTQHSQERAGFLTEINGAITKLGGTPQTEGTVKGSIYRQWMDVKATFTGTDEKAIIDSCLYGEEWAQKAYQDAMENKELPADVREMVERQHQASKQAYSELESMKKQHQH